MFRWLPLGVSSGGVGWGGWGYLQVKKFEQVSSDDRQMSLQGVGGGYTGFLSHDACDVPNPHPTPDRVIHRQMPVKTLPSLKLRLQAVIDVSDLQAHARLSSD